MSNISAQGFQSGNKKQAIPQGTLVRDPFSWITEACMPDDFEWKDPLKIQIGEIFHLLDHQKDRQDLDLDPIIWVPTCCLLHDANGSYNCAQNICTAPPQLREESDEEVFSLPYSEDIDENNISSHDDESSNRPSSDIRDLMDEDVKSPTIPISNPHDHHASVYEYVLWCVTFDTYVPSSHFGRWAKLTTFAI